jgi:hypothetical protein
MASRCRWRIWSGFFFLDDAERELVTGLRGDHNRLGFSLQLTTARYIGRFLADPLEGVRPRSWTFWLVSCGSLIRRV